jgi:hypothetical protein
MLINTIKKSYRELIRHTDQVQPIVTVPEIRPAANSDNFTQSEMQARRLRRQRRLERTGQHGHIGWRVRTW